MNKNIYIFVLMTLSIVQLQFASEMVGIQPIEMHDTDDYIEVSKDHPAITESRILQLMFEDIPTDKDFIIPLNVEKFIFQTYLELMDRYKNIRLMGEDQFKAELPALAQDFKEFTYLKFTDVGYMEFVNAINYLDLTDNYLELFLMGSMPQIVSYCDVIFQAFERQESVYAQQRPYIEGFLKNLLSRNIENQNLFTKIFRKTIFVIYNNNLDYLKKSFFWKWILQEYDSVIARISLRELTSEYKNLGTFSDALDLVKIKSNRNTIDINLQKDLPFLLFLDRKEELKTMSIWLDRGRVREKNIYFSIEEQLNSIFAIPQYLENIITLNLDVELNHLPKNIVNLVNLQELRVESSLTEIPEFLLNLNSLKKFSFEYSSFGISSEQRLNVLKLKGVKIFDY